MSGRRTTRVVFCGTVAAAIAGVGIACSSFSSDEPAPATDDGGAEAGLEGAASLDGGTTDAETSVDLDAGAFCASADAQFCWSFDSEQLSLLGPSLSVRSSSKAPELLVVDSGLSAPNAMASRLADGGYQGVQLTTAPDGVSYLRCDADLFFDAVSAPNGSTTAILQLDFDGSGFNVPIVKVTKTSETTLRGAIHYEGLGDVDLGNLPLGSWVHVYIDTHLQDGFWTLGAQVLTNKAGGLTIGARPSLPHFDKIFFGLASFDALTEWHVRYDNLVCQWH